ncbi:GTPase Era [Campylobacter geochelonis]|uniref:GTPase Era n=1 Tax=Campylobacter geochelonis TaxID=1780362 RepID=A0A128ER08_9BACT|nr:GTPase Era [Campylobacter geochelonis]QKF71241.1 GTP-binding protein [Campylobacter geochelonis]CZE49179.1 GTP-binding protein Era [Campylobacter geochelonis]CZE51508.1 GTP-binding protein Era [Campylobacter geochelonis]
MKSGFVSLIGRTNAGKSSLLNYLLGEKISMVSHKVNATRRKINGIVMKDENQIIFVDTPGLHDSNKMINKLMIDVAIKSIGDADMVLFLASIHDDLSDYEKFLQIKNLPPHIVLLTKTDEASNEKIAKKLTQYQQFQDKFRAIMPVNIKKNIYKAQILNEICKYLPEHEYYYDPQLLSSTNTKDIYRDFILEAIFDSVSSEIPYSSDVVINKVIENENLISIYADIITDTQSHKKILIGKNGDTVKRIGIKSKKLISAFSKVKIFINIKIIIKKDWNSNENVAKKHFIY